LVISWDKHPLFEEDFQAWANGPVCRELYDQHRGKYNISLKDMPSNKGDEKRLSLDQINTIDAILKHYGNKEPQWLSTLTHMEKPWNDARVGFAEGENCENIITKGSMKKYYGSL
jgi:uncharacterized phage-associated protein